MSMVPRLAAEEILRYLPREKSFFAVELAKIPYLYYDQFMWKVPTFLVSKYQEKKRIRSSILRNLRLVCRTFYYLLDFSILAKQYEIDLFKKQYSAIIFRELIFDYRWCVFPLEKHYPLYEKPMRFNYYWYPDILMLPKLVPSRMTILPFIDADFDDDELLYADPRPYKKPQDFIHQIKVLWLSNGDESPTYIQPENSNIHQIRLYETNKKSKLSRKLENYKQKKESFKRCNFDIKRKTNKRR